MTNARATFERDQAAAAEAQARSLLLDNRDPRDYGGEVRTRNHPAWVLAWSADLQARIAVGRIDTCGHLNLPAPAFCLAWDPKRLACRDCADTAARELEGTEETHTCDRCRRRVDDPEPLSVLAPGGLILLAGLCSPCSQSTGGAA